MPTSTRTTHARFHETHRQIRNCPTGGQSRPPLQNIVRFRRWRVRICDCILPGRCGHRPLRVRAIPHWCGQICNVVPHDEIRNKKDAPVGGVFSLFSYILLYATAILLAACALLYASSRLEAKDLPPVISLICASRYGVMFLPWMCSAFACATACSMMPFM